MSKSKSPEQKALFGHRRADDDGFTYLYGKFKGADRFGKGGYGVKSKRDIDSIGKQVRHDKRAVKAKELRRTERELQQEYAA
jgi:hypothetical protein